MQHCGDNNIRYDYWCSVITDGRMEAATSASSGCNEVNGKPLEYLDRHTAQCGANQVMTGFHLTNSGCSGDNMRYHISCAEYVPRPQCPLRATPLPPPSLPPSPPPSPWSGPYVGKFLPDYCSPPVSNSTLEAAKVQVEATDGCRGITQEASGTFTGRAGTTLGNTDTGDPKSNPSPDRHPQSHRQRSVVPSAPFATAPLTQVRPAGYLRAGRCRQASPRLRLATFPQSSRPATRIQAATRLPARRICGWTGMQPNAQKVRQ